MFSPLNRCRVSLFRVFRVFRGKNIMILSDIKRYFQQHQSVTLQNLVLHFQSEPDAIRGMLEHWIRKGKIRKQTIENRGCKGCSECSAGTIERYEWLA